jgi:hypothetical protein
VISHVVVPILALLVPLPIVGWAGAMHGIKEPASAFTETVVS